MRLQEPFDSNAVKQAQLMSKQRIILITATKRGFSLIDI